MEKKAKKNFENEMTLIVKALSENESFSRSVVAAFAVQLNPTLDEVNDIKTAVSEAVTNCVVHAYEGKGEGYITVNCRIKGSTLHIAVSDEGVGIADVAKAREPFYTTKPEQERSGMGFTVMETFMTGVEVESAAAGTTVRMYKAIGKGNAVKDA